MNTSQKRVTRKKWASKKDELPMLFNGKNYFLLGLGIALIFIGYIGMYIERAMDGFYSLYISPLLIIGGFGVVAYAVMFSDKGAVDEEKQSIQVISDRK